jgi:hypothetical protein
MVGVRSVIQSIKTAADAALALLWIVVTATYLLGLASRGARAGGCRRWLDTRLVLVRHHALFSSLPSSEWPRALLSWDDATGATAADAILASRVSRAGQKGWQQMSSDSLTGAACAELRRRRLRVPAGAGSCFTCAVSCVQRCCDRARRVIPFAGRNPLGRCPRRPCGPPPTP